MSLGHRVILTFLLVTTSWLGVFWTSKVVLVFVSSAMVNLIWLWDDLLPQHLKHRRLCERYQMKTIKMYDQVKRVSNDSAEALVKSGVAQYVPKHLFKKMKEHAKEQR